MKIEKLVAFVFTSEEVTEMLMEMLAKKLHQRHPQRHLLAHARAETSCWEAIGDSIILSVDGIAETEEVE